MIIGEAPGADEDAAGLPFVGRAGQLLDQILESVGLQRDSIYVMNIVKFRPPGNRNPTPAEIAASEPVLLEEIRLVNPQVIVPLGNVPTQYLLGTREGITKLHGNSARRRPGPRSAVPARKGCSEAGGDPAGQSRPGHL